MSLWRCEKRRQGKVRRRRGKSGSCADASLAPKSDHSSCSSRYLSSDSRARFQLTPPPPVQCESRRPRRYVESPYLSLKPVPVPAPVATTSTTAVRDGRTAIIAEFQCYGGACAVRGASTKEQHLLLGTLGTLS